MYGLTSECVLRCVFLQPQSIAGFCLCTLFLHMLFFCGMKLQKITTKILPSICQYFMYFFYKNQYLTIQIYCGLFYIMLKTGFTIKTLAQNSFFYYLIISNITKNISISDKLYFLCDLNLLTLTIC